MSRARSPLHVVLWSICLLGAAPAAWSQEPAPSSTPTTEPVVTPEPAPSVAPRPVAARPRSHAKDDEDFSATPEPEPKQQHHGFTMVAGIGLNLGVTLGSSGSSLSAITMQQGGVALGWKQGRVLMTVGAEFANISVNSTVSTTPALPATKTSQSTSSFLLIPGLQVALVRSHDSRVEMIAAARFGFGGPITESDPPSSPATPAPSRWSFMYEVAPGVRFWAHRSFALNLLGGFRGDYSFSSGGSVGTNSSSVGLNGIFASLGGMGTF